MRNSEVAPRAPAVLFAGPAGTSLLERRRITIYRGLSFVVFALLWYWLTRLKILPPFFFGEPTKVAEVLWRWFSSGSVFQHLWITLLETALAFVFGTLLGLIAGLWLGLNPTASAVAHPYFTAINSMPRVILAPIFAVWFGLGVVSKVALGITLVFFLVFFNVFNGVRDVNPTLLANAKMLGFDGRQLVRHVYVPSAMSWVFASLHNSVGMAFVGAVVGEYLGSARGIGYLILQAEGVFDINSVFAGILVLTFFAVGLDRLVSIAEKRLLAWKPK